MTVVAEPRSAHVREALDELADLVRHVFAAGRPALTAEEWAGLLHGHNTTPAQRLVLLGRLAIPADTRIGTAAVPFHDRMRKPVSFATSVQVSDADVGLAALALRMVGALRLAGARRFSSASRRCR